jgi:hypothetical protein
MPYTLQIRWKTLAELTDVPSIDANIQATWREIARRVGIDASLLSLSPVDYASDKVTYSGEGAAADAAIKKIYALRAILKASRVAPRLMITTIPAIPVLDGFVCQLQKEGGTPEPIRCFEILAVIYNDLTISSFKKVFGEQRHYRVLFSSRINASPLLDRLNGFVDNDGISIVPVMSSGPLVNQANTAATISARMLALLGPSSQARGANSERATSADSTTAVSGGSGRQTGKQVGDFPTLDFG